MSFQFLVFEYVERNLLEVLEQNPHGLGAEEVRWVTVGDDIRDAAGCVRCAFTFTSC